MKTIITTLAILIMLNAGARGQESVRIRGQICNGINHSAMKDCHVYVDGKVTGTISDQHGEFSIEIPLQYLDRNLNVSHVGFEVISTPISEIRNTFVEVKMMESPIWLTEVTIVPDEKGIVDDAIASVRDEFSDETDMLTAFYEVLLMKDKDQLIIKNVLAGNYLK